MLRIVAESLIRHEEVVSQRPMRPQALLLESIVVRPHGVVRIGVPIGDEAEVFDKGELVFGCIDLAAKQSDPRAVAPRIGQELKGVASRPRRTPQHAHDQAWIVRDQLFERARPVVGNVEKERTPRAGTVRAIVLVEHQSPEVQISQSAIVLHRDPHLWNHLVGSHCVQKPI